MTILQRYVTREFLKIFALCFGGLLGTYVLVDFFQRIDLFLNFPTPVRWKLLYFALKMPLFVFHITPVSLLVALLVTLGILNRNREITAVKCGGITLVHICAPLVLAGAAASALVFLTNEFLVPAATREAQAVLDVRIKNRPMRSIFRQNRIWFYGERQTIYNIQLLDPVEQSIEGVTLYRFDRSGRRLNQRIDARSARYRRGRWDFTQVTIRTFLPDGGIRTVSYPRRSLKLPERPQDISQYRERPEEMNFRALAEYVRKLRRSGFNPASYVVDLHAKLALPLVSLVVALLAIPFAFRAGPSGGIVASLGASITLGFAYWIVLSIGISLGHAGRLAPSLAAWLPNVFFVGLAAYLWLHLEQ
ncbi:MAG TPA: LPS export ABC transporter permease LptG [bacterium]